MKRCLFIFVRASVIHRAPVFGGAICRNQSVVQRPRWAALYSLRDQLKQQGATALDFVKALGFVEVEIGLKAHYGLTAEAMKARGLKPIAAHASLDFILNQTE